MDLFTSLPCFIVLSSAYPSLYDNPISDYRDHPFKILVDFFANKVQKIISLSALMFWSLNSYS